MMKDKNDHIKSRIKLAKLPKKKVYSVPDNYFTELPGIIQSRVVKPEQLRSPLISWTPVLRYALPVLTLIMMLVYFGTRLNNNDIDIQAMLDDVPTEELVNYLTESDISTDELLSLIDIDELDVDGMIEDNIELLNDSEWDELLEEYPDIENDI
jgi:hypothetical protein